MTLQAWLTHLGPLGVAVGSAIEGDVVPLVAGVGVHLGLLDPVTAVCAATLGLLAGDSAWFWLGRRAGPRVRATAAWRQLGPTVERLATRFGPAEIALARGVYGTRNLSMLFWGAQGLPYGRFLLVDVPTCVAWSVLLVTLGRTASGGAAAVLGEVERVERWLLGAALVAAAAVWAWRTLARRRLR